MKLNKQVAKEGIKNQLIIIGYMIIFNIISFFIFLLTNIDVKPTGNISGSFFAITEYKINVFYVIFFWIIFLLLFSVFYTKKIKKIFIKQKRIHWSFVLLFLVMGVLFILVELAIYIISLLFRTGLFSSIVNYPSYMYIVVIIYIVGYILLDILKEHKNKFKDEGKIKFERK